MSRSKFQTLCSFLPILLGGAFVAGSGFYQSVPAHSPGLMLRETSGRNVQARLQVQPPGDAAPSGETLGEVKFAPPGDTVPRSSIGGETRGEVKFAPPGDAAPRNSASGASRRDVTFAPPGDAAPRNSASGASRRDVTFAPPGDATPRNTTSGASRNEIGFVPPDEPVPANTASSGARTDEQPLLRALLPETQHGRTVSPRPTFFVFVPPTASQEVFFSLQDERRNHVYQTILKISGSGGIVSFTLPEDAPELEMGKNYIWFFAPIVPGGSLEPDNYGVVGWIKRVEALTSARNAAATPVQLATEYAKAGVWYDTVAVLANALDAQPDNTSLLIEWQDLLKQVGLEAIATQPLTERL